MTTLVIMRGLQGSGKTTWAKAWVAEDPGKRMRVNRDTLREMTNNYQAYEDTGTAIIRARDALIKTFLNLGMDVVCDDTNLPSRTVKDLLKIAALCKAETRIVDLTNTPLEVCIERDLARKEWRYGKWAIGADIITDAYNKFVKGKGYPLPVPSLEEGPVDEVQPYVPDRTKPLAIMIDIDGTVAKMVSRSPYDETRVNEDIPNVPVIGAVQAMVRAGYHPIFCSGRKDTCREATVEWIETHVMGPDRPYELYMRAANDGRKDSFVKTDLFNNHIRHRFNVSCVFDDRDQVVAAWRAMGLTVFQVDYGNF